ncbi:MAG: chaperone modulator CbpM [Xanthomonadales bacterium]|nr:chaperone modulator CbpM [Xanthomonadales bacterium]
MTRREHQSLSGELLDEGGELTLGELCRICSVSEDRIMELVEEGIVEPGGRDPSRWRFRSVSVRRVRCAVRLERDLGINAPGAALALDLLDELEVLRARLRRFERG